jgi:hypothetical protein
MRFIAICDAAGASLLLAVSITLLGDGGVLSQTLFVGHDGVLVSHDISSGNERPGSVTNVTSPTDMQAIEDGTVFVNPIGGNAGHSLGVLR